jgi:glycosyltransferase involved in cell wall biosynthesis/predicted metal-dependent phosphoesterase TrpH
VALVDLHVHSIHSEHPSEWFLQRLGAKESYTDPDLVYQKAMKAGMSFVTITDHNSITGALMLKKKYPKDTFVGVETTAYFPEDRCKIHILIYDIDENQFDEIQKIRENIYLLRDYIRDNRIAYSVAHATYSVNGKLTITHLEKLILLFDVFEGINGGRNSEHNTTWSNVLKNLDKQKIDELYARYKIEPISSDPWIKGFTGGSDDHAGLFIGRTYTYANESELASFISLLKNKKTLPGGKHNDYQSLAFSIYKIAYDFSKTQQEKMSPSLIGQLTERLFADQSMNIVDRYNINRMKKRYRAEGNKINLMLCDLVYSLKVKKNIGIEEKLDILVSYVEKISDELFYNLFHSLDTTMNQGDLLGLIRSFASSVPGMLLTIPFFTTLRHMSGGKAILEYFKQNYLERSSSERKILWFTDTINDVNGVSVTLKNLGWVSHKSKRNISLVTSLPESEMLQDMPPNILNLPFVYEFQLPIYESYTLRIPSILSSVSKIFEHKPDEIYISTPGPVGLLGLLVANLLSIKCTGIYHTDFTAQYLKIDDNVPFGNLIESYTKWFYGALDKIKVPSAEYISLLGNRGFDGTKMSVFKRGIDIECFRPNIKVNEDIYLEHKINEGVNLIYAGRISKDKNLDFLIDVYRSVCETLPEVNLLFVGEGPYLQELKTKTKNISRIHYLGAISQKRLPEIYNAGDLLVFPSNTDTFGMVVLEAQACGLPALVSDQGGPQSIVIADESGFVLPANDLDAWKEKLVFMIRLMKTDSEKFREYGNNARDNVINNYSWRNLLNDIFPPKPVFEAHLMEAGNKLSQVPRW